MHSPSPNKSFEPQIIHLKREAAILVRGVHLVFGLLQALFAWWGARTPERDAKIISGFQKSE
jgi:hypothetical protein